MKGLLERYIQPRIGAGNPNDPRYWQSSGSISSAGINITADTVLGFNAAFAATRIIAEDAATLPVDILRKRPNGTGRDPVPGHPLDVVFNVRANDLQIALEFREWMTRVATFYPEAIAEIEAGRVGFVEKLRPLHPSWLKRQTLPSGRVRYELREPQKQPRFLELDEVFRLPSPLGVGLIDLMKEDVGAALATKSALAALAKNGLRPTMVALHPGHLEKKAQRNLKNSLEDNSGWQNTGKWLVLEEGISLQEVGIKPEDAQAVAQMEFTILDMARWFRIKPHKLAYMLTQTYASVEQSNIEHVTDTIRPWTVRWENAVRAQLFLDPLMYIRHNLDALLRGDSLSRAQVMEIQKRIGMRNANELRALEDLNPRTDPGGEAYWDKQPGTGASNDPGSRQSRAYALAEAAATRVLNREKRAIEDRARHAGDDYEAWGAAVTDFYSRHAEMVTENLRVDEADAARYCEQKAEELVRDGLKATERWDTRDLALLIDMALGGAE